MSTEHDTTINAGSRNYWWTCSCGDEGGPHASYNEAWDATVEHERRSAPAMSGRADREDFEERRYQRSLNEIRAAMGGAPPRRNSREDAVTIEYEEYKALVLAAITARTMFMSSDDAHWRAKLAAAVEAWDTRWSLQSRHRAEARAGGEPEVTSS